MIKNETFKSAFKAAFPHTIPVLTGFLVLGAAYGVLMLKSGYSALWSVMMSALAFCGSMQFLAITLLTTVFDPIQAFLLSLMVNARHLFYGLAMLNRYKGMGRARAFLIYTLCDETFSIVSSIDTPEGVDKKQFYLSISLLNYIYWVSGTLIGGILGNFISFSTRGLDFALTALFVVLFIEQVKKKENRVSGLIGILAAALGLTLFGARNMVIPSMAFIMIILMAGREKLCC